ncbi:MAG: tRNA (adenosine(37)-N6)-dimethylallyltransferase MiaA [Wenzhouxiangellaceae bacterium]|nr:tRNA (adenosine(37)-N6)-dimethylallyltransferase MiaA [Wenzhouxiangellaceae bacterium]
MPPCAELQLLPPAIVLTGPTAAGKTAAAFALADAFDVHLVSADSSQVYRGMDIGTAKPSRAELERYPHALIDIRDPARPYNAAEFAADAEREIHVARARGQIPVIVGGTPLYLRALRYGLDPLPPADPALRAEIEHEAARSGWPAVHARLAALDPDSARRIAPDDPQRIQRALEICLLSGRPASVQRSGRGVDRMAGALHLVMAPGDRGCLHARIAERTDRMLAEGLIDETRALFARPDLGPDSTALRAVGYRQAGQLLAGQFDRAELAARIRAATRQLAKRQLTALRQWTGALWYDPLKSDLPDRILERVRRWLAGA